jgi:hypothetical protein
MWLDSSDAIRALVEWDPAAPSDAGRGAPAQMPSTDLAARLNRWARRMSRAFKLGSGPPPPVDIRRLRRGVLGLYRYRASGERILIDEVHAAKDEFWEVLGTLLHECTHWWHRYHRRPDDDEDHWTPQHHSIQFRAKALTFGLLIDSEGHTSYEAGLTPFTQLLLAHGVALPDWLVRAPSLVAMNYGFPT